MALLIGRIDDRWCYHLGEHWWVSLVRHLICIGWFLYACIASHSWRLWFQEKLQTLNINSLRVLTHSTFSHQSYNLLWNTDVGVLTLLSENDCYLALKILSASHAAVPCPQNLGRHSLRLKSFTWHHMADIGTRFMENYDWHGPWAEIFRDYQSQACISLWIFPYILFSI